jgi:hypothetical protein
VKLGRKPTNPRFRDRQLLGGSYSIDTVIHREPTGLSTGGRATRTLICKRSLAGGSVAKVENEGSVTENMERSQSRHVEFGTGH